MHSIIKAFFMTSWHRRCRPKILLWLIFFIVCWLSIGWEHVKPPNNLPDFGLTRLERSQHGVTSSNFGQFSKLIIIKKQTWKLKKRLHAVKFSAIFFQGKIEANQSSKWHLWLITKQSQYSESSKCMFRTKGTFYISKPAYMCPLLPPMLSLGQ